MFFPTYLFCKNLTFYNLLLTHINLDPNGSLWIPVHLIESHWVQMDINKSKCIQIDPNGSDILKQGKLDNQGIQDQQGY